MFDYEINKWVEVDSLIQGRFTHSAIVTGDYQKIIVFGGFQECALKSSEIFNVIDNKWNPFNNLVS